MNRPQARSYQSRQQHYSAGSNNNTPSPIVFPPIIDGDSLRKENIVLPQAVIYGILSRTEKLVLAGGSKSFKTWSLMDMGLSVACGIPWWGHETFLSHVVYLNLELSKPFFEDRLFQIAEARKVTVPNTFHVIHLRGAKLYDALRWLQFMKYLAGLLYRFPHPLLISDPIYKLMGGKNENSAGDVNMLMDQMEDMVQQTEGSSACGHHFTKGNQSEKEAIDRPSGSGVFQRDPDSLLGMTKHENDECYSTTYVLRNHPAIEDRVMEWKHPIFIPRGDLNPQDLKPRGGPPKYNVIQLADVLGERSLRTKAFQMRCFHEIGMSNGMFYTLLKKAVTAKVIARSVITEEWTKI